ncbi:MAG: M14 family metallopeptidase [Paraglaciecola sp.]|uniref:M14 metallopeptidase family protein n=1 Tax=Paraglaciecola sp. TaxID=1920173 RepID=UPI0027402C81|nr:M14 metallopeptidase family protein [Paraglaciecola sp.]MDP5029859.1 M14 family metallopeptidase [Paraglaciecola sp.]MDP5039275.1 M14 family metallopeptidase [Paraglaciecola sp.]MDP5130979.1 M14 family metallopeptidase [Paraglaciecola sp.]
MSYVFNLLFLSLIFLSQSSYAVQDKDYLPADTTYLPAVTTPTQALGSEVGEWHVRHDQLVSYMRTLAAQSERVSLVDIGRTHENRPLVLLAFTSAANQQNLANLQAEHIASLNGKSVSNSPLIIWMGYSVHGNESSGSNAALLIAYYLAAGQNEQIEQLLKDNIVLLDPSLNPDGLSRFAQWANMHKSRHLVTDPQNREHQEAWPSSRTNHYWFDLNRDWLLQVHPESKARVAQFHQWRPHVLTDFHEMGSDSTFFFQPGIPSRKNPWTPQENVELTDALGQFHARALDKNKQLYFTQESYDDFYYGKGSTYPDALGSIGILFEQASSRGHLRDTANGVLSFADTIQNQVTTSISTFAGALANKDGLLAYQQAFDNNTLKLSKKDALTGYVVQEARDYTRMQDFLTVLQAHHIDYWPLKRDIEVDDVPFKAVSSVFIPVQQAQYRLIKSLFSTRKSFDDNTFYDVSNWNLALAFNLQYAPVESKVDFDTNRNFTGKTFQSELLDKAYAYAFSWDDSSAATLLSRLLKAKVKVQVAGSPFVAQTSQGAVNFTAGSVVIPSAFAQPENLIGLLQDMSQDLPITLWSIDSGLTKQGIDLGSRQMHNLSLPKVLLVGGKETSQYEAGEVWHHFDQQLELPLTIVDLDRLASLDLTNYSHIIWVNGTYKNVSETNVKSLSSWLKDGGVLIGQKNAVAWFADKGWLKARTKTASDIALAFDSKGLQYSDLESFSAKQRIAGAVFTTNLDVSHPLAFGFEREALPMFKNSNQILLRPDAPFITVAKYTDKPLTAGYAAPELQDLVANSAAIVAHQVGKGRVIAFNDNMNFRGTWQGTSRLFTNAIFMASFINVPG